MAPVAHPVHPVPPAGAELAPAVTAATSAATSAAGRATRLPAIDPRTPEGRAPGVLDRVRRVVLADRLAGLVAVADGRVAGPCPAPRPALRAARGRLLELEHVLRSGIPVPRHGEHRAQRLIDDVATGAYADAAADELRRDAAAACAAMGSVTPFH